MSTPKIVDPSVARRRAMEAPARTATPADVRRPLARPFALAALADGRVDVAARGTVAQAIEWLIAEFIADPARAEDALAAPGTYAPPSVTDLQPEAKDADALLDEELAAEMKTGATFAQAMERVRQKRPGLVDARWGSKGRR